MNVRKIRVSCIALLLLFLISVLYSCFPTVPIDNNTPAAEIVSKDYGLMKLLLLKSNFRIRSGFGDVTAAELAEEVDIRLDCKRETSDNSFYYVICGDGYRLFLMTDRNDIAKDVLLVKSLPTKAEIQKQIDVGIKTGYNLVQMGIPGLDGGEPNILSSTSIYVEYCIFLQDGVVKWRTNHHEYPDEINYEFYSLEEWQSLKDRPDYFVIRPIDTIPWS